MQNAWKFTGRIIASTAMSSLLFAALPATAKSRAPQTQERVHQKRVNIADLDLRQVRDQRTLEARVRTAAKRVCSASEVVDPRDDDGLSLQSLPYGYPSQCAGDTFRDAKPRLLAMIERAKSGQTQLALTLVITRNARAH